MSFEQARAIADAVLYEGYVLYPYRASSKKNKWRWQFGVLAPRAWSEAGGCEAWCNQTECLLETAGVPTIRGRVRGLRLDRRAPAGDAVSPSAEPWDDGVEAAIDFERTIAPEELGVERVYRLALPAERGMAALSIVVALRADPVAGAPRLWKLRVCVENVTPWADPAASRDDALGASLVGVHTLLDVDGGSFVSVIEPPSAAVNACANVRTWPVLVAGGDHDMVLSAPIILYDHPTVAPESPGDLFDGTEIDEILTLRTLTLTDEEKREARATDPRAAAIVDRAESMTPEAWQALHGTRRDGAPSAPTDRAPTFPVGARVRLRPGARRTDAQDMFLVGRAARVERVLVDFEGNDHVAVTLEDDPAADLHQWYGRFLYFAPDEIEPLGETS